MLIVNDWTSRQKHQLFDFVFWRTMLCYIKTFIYLLGHETPKTEQKLQHIYFIDIIVYNLNTVHIVNY